MSDNQAERCEQPFVYPRIGTVASITAENFKAIAITQLERLAAYQNTMDTLSDSINVDELMLRYSTKKSYFDLAANWFGYQSILARVQIGVALIGISYLLGASYIMIGVIGTAIVFLMDNHYKVTREQDELIAEDLLHLKQSLVDSIHHLVGMSQIIRNTFISLCELNVRMADINTKLEENNTDLENKIFQFEEIVLALEKNKEALLSSTADLKIKLELAYSRIHQHEAAMDFGMQSIQASDRSLGETCAGFRTSLQKFDVFYHEQEEVIAEYRKFSALLKNKITEYEQALLKLSYENQVFMDLENNEDAEILVNEISDDVEQTIRMSHLLCERLEKEIASQKLHYPQALYPDENLVEKRRAYSCEW